MQVMQSFTFAVIFIAALTQLTLALPAHTTRLSTTINQITESNQNASISKRGLRNLFHRKKKSEEEIQEEAKAKVLLSSDRELKSKYLKKLSDEDFHKYMSQHISRLNHIEANKLAKHLDEKALKHSGIRAKGLDAIHAQLKQNVQGYNGEYEKAHWSEVENGKTSEIAKDINPTVDHLHQVISESQKEINRLHDASKTLDKHINDLWKKHKWERQQEGKDVKKSTVATLREAYETNKKISMYPNLKKTFEAHKEAKQAQEAAKIKQQEEEKARKGASASGWPLQGSIGRALGFKSSSKNSRNEESNKSQSSSGNQKDKGKGKLDVSVGGSGKGESRKDQEGSTSSSNKNSSGRSDDEDGSGVSSQDNSQSNSPTSVIPGYSTPGSKSYHRKNTF